jgi:hypothetical protein
MATESSVISVAPPKAMSAATAAPSRPRKADGKVETDGIGQPLPGFHRTPSLLEKLETRADAPAAE